MRNGDDVPDPVRTERLVADLRRRSRVAFLAGVLAAALVVFGGYWIGFIGAN